MIYQPILIKARKCENSNCLKDCLRLCFAKKFRKNVCQKLLSLLNYVTNVHRRVTSPSFIRVISNNLKCDSDADEQVKIVINGMRSFAFRYESINTGLTITRNVTTYRTPTYAFKVAHPFRGIIDHSLLSSVGFSPIRSRNAGCTFSVKSCAWRLRPFSLNASLEHSLVMAEPP